MGCWPHIRKGLRIGVAKRATEKWPARQRDAPLTTSIAGNAERPVDDRAIVTRKKKAEMVKRGATPAPLRPG
jgi:hypothetical protein